MVFDVTYQTNNFGMPFTTFTGVKQSALFGCALIADETRELFTRLFQTWLRCMRGKMSISIITNQDKAMNKAIKTVFPGTNHQ